MDTITADELQANLLDIVDHVPPEGLTITKQGKGVATIYPSGSDIRHLYGAIPDLFAQGEDDLFSTGLRWDAES